MSLPSEFGVTLLFETIGTVVPSSSSPLYERDKTVAPVQRTVLTSDVVAFATEYELDHFPEMDKWGVLDVRAAVDYITENLEGGAHRGESHHTLCGRLRMGPTSVHQPHLLQGLFVSSEAVAAASTCGRIAGQRAEASLVVVN